MLKGLQNGLGYEELNQPGSIVSSLWLTGSVVADSFISGLTLHSAGVITGKNVSLTGSTSSVDLTGKNLKLVGSIVGTTGSIPFDSALTGKNMLLTGSVSCVDTIATGTTSGIIVFGKNITATGSAVVNGQVLAGVSTGSPAIKGQLIQTGSIALNAGSIAWAVFGQTFTTIPKVNANYSDLALGSPAGLMNVCGSLANLGSVYLMGATPSKVVDWMAVGGK